MAREIWPTLQGLISIDVTSDLSTPKSFETTSIKQGYEIGYEFDWSDILDYQKHGHKASQNHDSTSN